MSMLAEPGEEAEPKELLGGSASDVSLVAVVVTEVARRMRGSWRK